MNMVRHWGGGYYETDEFYDMCDELGIMIWQDFMFGNDWQPGTYDWKLNVAKEAEQQLERLRNHPSIVIWCGNNETEVALAWKDRDKLARRGPLPDVAGLRLHLQRHSRRRGQSLRARNSLLAQLTQRRLRRSSPTSTSPATCTTGRVWHGRVPFTDYEKHNPRFMTEYGFQSFPEMRTVEAFTIPEDRLNIFTPVMLAHQKNNAGNAIIRDYMLRDYPQPKDFASFLYASQVLQAEGIKVGAEHLRRNRPRTMGSIYWQLERLLAGRLMVEPRLLRTLEGASLLRPPLLRAHSRLAASGGRQRRGVHRLRQNVADGRDPARAYPDLRWSSPERQVAASSNCAARQQGIPHHADARHHQPTQLRPRQNLRRNRPAGGQQNDLEQRAVLRSQERHAPAGGQDHQRADQQRRPVRIYTLHLASPVLAKSVYISFGNLDAKLSDNYFDLLPGQAMDMSITSAASLEELKQNMRVISLTDAFAPHEAQVSAGTN